MANLNSESYHSLIGFHTPEYLGFLKLQVVPRFMGTGTCISPVNRNRSILTSLMFCCGWCVNFAWKFLKKSGARARVQKVKPEMVEIEELLMCFYNLRSSDINYGSLGCRPLALIDPLQFIISSDSFQVDESPYYVLLKIEGWEGALLV